MKDYQNIEDLVRNMTDAGCSESTIACFCNCISHGDKKEGLCILERRREELLNEIHKSRSCIEFLNRVFLSIKEEHQSALPGAGSGTILQPWKRSDIFW